MMKTGMGVVYVAERTGPWWSNIGKKWRRSVLLFEDGSIFVPAAIAGKVSDVKLLSQIYREPMTAYHCHLFVSVFWMMIAYPKTKTECRRLIGLPEIVEDHPILNYMMGRGVSRIKKYELLSALQRDYCLYYDLEKFEDALKGLLLRGRIKKVWHDLLGGDHRYETIT